MLRCHFIACAALFLVSVSDIAVASPPPAPTGAAGLRLDGFSSAPGAWKPSLAAAAPVPAPEAGQYALRFPCPFPQGDIERITWDLDLRIDLGESRGLRFHLLCGNPEPISGFTFYYRSGGGWYSAPFSLNDLNTWNLVTVAKTEMGTEGNPAGWGNIDGIRIAAWRGGNAATEFLIANAALIPAEAPLAIVRGDWAARQHAPESRAIQDAAKTAARLLDDLGLDYAVISDDDLTDRRVAGRKALILPYNPAMPDAATACLRRFTQGGGGLVSFFRLPPAVQAAADIRAVRGIAQERPGYFARIHAAPDAPPGMPDVTRQMSWNIETVEPVGGKGRIAAYWHDDTGQNTGHPAVVITDRAAHMTHILLRDDPENKRLLLLAMIGPFAPACWKDAAQFRIRRAGTLGPYADFADAIAALRAQARDEATRNAITEAEAQYARARQLFQDRGYASAIAAAEAARDRLVEVYCRAQTPQPGEQRLFWCHDAYGVPGKTWDESARILAENGFTAVIPNMLWGGVAYYPSRVLPVAPQVAKQGDAIAACLAASRKYGLQCHIWKVCWNMGARTPQSFRDRMRAEGRIQKNLDGAPVAEWLCPSHPANQRLEVDSLVEVVRNYAVDGVHLDYIRYPDRRTCFCEGCRERFEKRIGTPVRGWPKAVTDDPALQSDWREFRRDQITAVVAAVHREVRAARPGVKISAAVFPNWPLDRDNIGQDWKTWCERGYLDFLCPMNYTPGIAQFEHLVRRQREWVGATPLYPGIGLSVWPAPDRMVTLIDQINATRKHKTGGFTVFNLGAAEAEEILPRCGMGITRRP